MKKENINSAAFWQAPAIQEELIRLIMDLCAIPAPSGQEQKRADFINKWLSKECHINASIDTACNVLVLLSQPDPKNSAIPKSPSRLPKDSGLSVFMAHTDTVFPDTGSLPVRRTEDRICSPGAGDDTACAAILMMFLKYGQPELKNCRKPLLFAFNSCEEGLGNLKGSRQIIKDYSGKICEVTSFDGGVKGICNHAVGSLRYQITVSTRGGHSYNDFGSRNAILVMSHLAERLYRLQVPAEGRSTYNAGVITGGTSVNTIAQSCRMLFEYRSDRKESLKLMQSFFFETLSALQSDFPDIRLEYVLVGERPCMGDVDSARQQALTERALASIRKFTDAEEMSVIGSGSTDCNIPLSQGIPAICFGGLLGEGVHTREEYVTIPLLLQEAAIISDYLLSALSL
ncbi:MAG: M20/M25/M40 family metallo-hydrolase [Lachnospiraceae bacterium]|nr:M20/M25/M40 family metallo-hydrolase [Lachnospiraceae bacterium]